MECEIIAKKIYNNLKMYLIATLSDSISSKLHNEAK